ncbi:lipopolysaccharide biosynthesis protein [Herbinix hemicellulosilytica]|uniref:Putative membrane protein n=1 Tax=Herbinix hemicellulosilytica TaxID=1564487 RepID=A0A0H5SG66_HERHM|nr:oligosaccharide flippase family protein [Herbinix hemicellulosilytica]CRZ34487.1 putative membrane protein [Herbinix hemicellulosilytica]
MNLKKLFKSTGIYFLGNTLSKVISLVLVPLYTKYLNPTDYGTYDIIITYLNIGILIIFLDIGGATLRFIYEQTDYKKVIDNSLCIFIISSTIYTIGFWLISLIVNIDNAFIVFLYGLLSAIVQYMSYIARGLSKSRLFALSGVIGTLFTGLFNVIFIKVLNYGYASLFLSYIIASIIQILILELNMKLFKNFKLININISLIKKIFAFALPLSINYIGVWFLSSYNKVAVTNILGLHQNGLYAITNKFSMILTFVSTSFLYAWQEMAFSIKGSNMEKGVIFGKAIRNYIKVLTPISIGLIAFIWFAFPYVVDEKYYQAINYIPLSIIAITISVLYNDTRN